MKEEKEAIAFLLKATHTLSATLLKQGVETDEMLCVHKEAGEHLDRISSKHKAEMTLPNGQNVGFDMLMKWAEETR